jgi:serine/threonine protein kinase
LVVGWFLASSSFAAPMETTFFNNLKKLKIRTELSDITNSGASSPANHPTPKKNKLLNAVTLEPGNSIILSVNDKIAKLKIISGPKKGSTADVFETEDDSKKKYAFKYFKCIKDLPEKNICEDEPKYIKNELYALKKLESFVQSGVYENRNYIIMKFDDGKPITEITEIMSKDLQYYTTAAKNAVDELHKKGIVHNDLHINNILFVSGTPIKAKIIDFGRSGIATHDSITRDKNLLEELFEDYMEKYERTLRYREGTQKITPFSSDSHGGSPRTQHGTSPKSPAGYKVGRAFGRK